MKAVLTAVVAMLVIAGCGEDEEPAPATTEPPAAATGAGGSSGVDAAGTPEPGEPSYAVIGSYWSELPIEERVASAEEFIADHPEECAGVNPEDLSRQTGVAYGIDYPRTTVVGDAMLETCALLRDGQ